MKIDKLFPYLQYKGSSTFKFTFTIDFDFYDKGAGGKGSKTGFWFVLNCRTGQIVEFENISVVYIDPPYQKYNLNKFLKNIINKINSDTIVALEASVKDHFEIPKKINVFQKKTYGRTIIYFLRLY